MLQKDRGFEKGPANETYGASLYVAFWKPIYVTLGLLQAVIACWLVRQVWAEPVGYAYGLVFLLSALLAYGELEAFARAMGWQEGPIFDWRDRTTVLVAAGFAIAVSVTALLAVQEARDRDASGGRAEESARENAAFRERMNSSDVQRGMKAMEAARERREAGARTGASSTGPTSRP